VATGNPTLGENFRSCSGWKDDGFWGPKSQQALNDELKEAGGGGGGNGPFEARGIQASRDPKDVEDFKKCKAQGKTDKQCFAVGDNGIGSLAKLTAQTTTPMVAIHPSDAKKRWGSMDCCGAPSGAGDRRQQRSVVASVEDQLGVAGRIDLNPAAAKELGLNPSLSQGLRVGVGMTAESRAVTALRHSSSDNDP